MKILVSSYEFPPIGGGGAKVVEGLTRTLAEAGHSIDIVTMHFKDLPFRERNGRIAIYRVPGIRRKAFVCTSLEMIPYIARALGLALRLARENRYDINHTHFIFPDGIIAWLVFRMTGLPYILTVHGSDVPGYNPDRFTLMHKVLAPVWAAVVRNACLVVCPSERLERLVKAALPAARTAVIPNGFDASRFTPRYPRRNRILCVTRMLERKGVQYLLEALQGMPLEETQLHIAGDGPYLPALKEKAQALGVNAVFHGFLGNDSAELKELFETSKIFVFTSASENFPNVLLEAMAAGCAIITTRGTGCDEVTGETAMLVEPRNAAAIRAALQRLLAGDAECLRLSQAARQRVQSSFAWETVADAYLRHYECGRRAV